MFLVQPCDISIKWRTNLAPKLRPEIPHSTTCIEISDITLSIDEEVYKDIQYLTKFLAWHSSSVHKTSYLKFRPAYNTPVKGNAKAYWKYAINATLYLIRKQGRGEKKLKAKRQAEMRELAELFKLKKINDYYLNEGLPERLLGFTDSTTGSEKKFESEELLRKRIEHLEYKLTPE